MGIMRIVVSDTSCLIDLRKTNLLEAFAQLPYKIMIPDILIEHEFVKFKPEDKNALIDNGVQIVELSESGIERITQIQVQNAALSVYDCFAFVVAENHPGSILLTGDKRLRTLAIQSGIESHGVLWVINELNTHDLVTPRKLHRALTFFEQDETVRIPAIEIKNLLRKLEVLF